MEEDSEAAKEDAYHGDMDSVPLCTPYFDVYDHQTNSSHTLHYCCTAVACT